MRTKISLLACLFLLTITPIAKSWWDPGHMVTAMIAWQNMNDEAKTEATRLLKVLETTYPYTNHFVVSSTWADDLKAEGVYLYSTWHYTNIPYNPDNLSIPESPEVDVVWAIENCKNVIQSKDAKDLEKARALAFLVHFVGDLHQPLHSTTMYTHEQPGGNRGGNSFRIKDSHGNLHKLWDDGCGYLSELNDIRPYGQPKEPISDQNLTRVEAFAQNLEKSYPQNTFPEVNNLDPDFWALESHKIAVKHCYGGYNGMQNNRKDFLDNNETPSPEYLENGQEIVKKQLSLGGYRLAGVLNELLGK